MAASHATKNMTENIVTTTTTKAEFAENIAQIGVPEDVFLRETLVKCSIPKLVVLLFFLGIRKYGVGFSGRLNIVTDR
jgi:hypothetical protein